MGSRILIRGAIGILMKKKPIARKIQGLFQDRGMKAAILEPDNPKLELFLKKGNGLLITDTYLGFQPVRKLIDSNNFQVAVVFLRRSNDAFEEKSLKCFGSFVVGIFEEDMDTDQLEEIIRLAIKYESDVDPVIIIDGIDDN